ncbi:MAG: hypothetical protein KatS3mg130_1297 [Candidatus Sumerlaea sp.]|nr:MAG: hypothetical protein KatS3mg130_1297 [Candidatus Sumerlaea sp.]
MAKANHLSNESGFQCASCVPDGVLLLAVLWQTTSHAKHVLRYATALPRGASQSDVPYSGI